MNAPGEVTPQNLCDAHDIATIVCKTALVRPVAEWLVRHDRIVAARARLAQHDSECSHPSRIKGFPKGRHGECAQCKQLKRELAEAEAE